MTQPRPAIAPPPLWEFPPVTRRVLDNGVTVLVYDLPGQHVVSAGLLLPVPLNVEPRHLEGVAALTAQSLDQGTTRHSGPAFADAVEGVGAVTDAGVGFAHAEVSVDVPGSHLGAVAPLLLEMVQSPELADDDILRQRDVRIAQLHQLQARSADRAHLALRHHLIDPLYREQRLAGGEIATLSALTPDDVRAHHARWFSPRGSTLVIAGDSPAADVDAFIDTIASWHQTDTAPVDFTAPAPQAGRAMIVDRPGSVQAELRWGWFTIDRADPQWAAFQLGAHAVGGGFLSRLNKVLREELGYTYGVHLAHAPMRHAGMSYVQGSFRNEVLQPTLERLPDLLDVNRNPLTAREVTEARDYLQGVTPLRFATAAGVCDGVMSLLAANLSARFIDRQRLAWERVTADNATAATAALIRPDAGTLVIVGDADALEPQVRAAGWEPTVER